MMNCEVIGSQRQESRSGFVPPAGTLQRAFSGTLGSSQMPVCHYPPTSMPMTRYIVHDFMIRTMILRH